MESQPESAFTCNCTYQDSERDIHYEAAPAGQGQLVPVWNRCLHTFRLAGAKPWGPRRLVFLKGLSFYPVCFTFFPLATHTRGPLRPEYTVKIFAVAFIFFSSGITLRTDVLPLVMQLILIAIGVEKCRDEYLITHDNTRLLNVFVPSLYVGLR